MTLKKDFFLGRGWFQGKDKKIIALEVSDEEYFKQPIHTLESGRKVRYIIVGERPRPDELTNATHYIARDLKAPNNEGNGQGQENKGT